MRTKFASAFHTKCFRRFILFAIPYALCSMLLLFFPCPVLSQGLIQGFSGNLEFNYTFYSSKTKLESGETTKTEAVTYNPRITLNVNTNIFPNIKLDAGAIFEGDLTKTKIEDTRSEITTMTMRPHINLSFNNPLIKASIGYYRRQERTAPKGGENLTLINDDYIANLNWRPEGLPSIETQLIRRNTYDQDKSIIDTTKDYVSLASRYSYEGLELKYWGSYDNVKNDIVETETTTLTNYGRANYSNSFFDKRVYLNTTYEITRQETKISAEGTGGEVDFQVFPISGLSSLDNTPLDTPLLPNPALIDGNLTASAGIDIGLPPLGGDLSDRNMGFDFFIPSEVDKILVWVDRELPPDIANSFEWRVYVSPDNLIWTFAEAIFSAPFGPFENRFEIKFSGVTARYVKVVTKPLSAIVPGSSAFPNIFITEIQAFTGKPVSEVKDQKITRTTHNYTLDIKTRILNLPTLYHELNYIYYRQDPDGNLRYTLSNALSMDYRFSQIFSGRTRVAYEYGEEEKEKRTAYIYNASIDATPLNTLRNSLIFSGRFEEIGGEANNNNSVFLYNTAQLYKGLDVNLNLGYSFSKRETGEKINEGRINLLTNIVPHPRMNIAFDYSYTNTRQSGGDRQSPSTYTQRGGVTLSYTPIRTLFLLGTVEVIAEKGEKRLITQDYGINWSPFPDGALRFSLAYNENYNTIDHKKERVFTPSIRYDITKKSYINVSYNMIRSRSDTQKIDSNFFSVTLKMFF
jgi:hypothetical protein